MTTDLTEPEVFGHDPLALSSTRRLSRSGVDGSRPSPPFRIGVCVDGSPSGGDAVVLASHLVRGNQRGADAHRRLRRAAPRTRGASQARIVVHSDARVRRGLCRLSHRGHRDLLVVGSDRRAGDRQVTLRHRARQLLWHLGCPLAIAPPRHGQPRQAANSSESASDSTTVPEPRAALKLAGSRRGGRERRPRGARSGR
jgi:hypothetical protein